MLGYMACHLGSVSAEPFRAPLISVDKNLRVDVLEISGKKVTPKAPGRSEKKE